jgi:two-component system LytT family response regulator
MDKPKLTAILIDDEVYALSNLNHLIKTHCSSIHVVDTANSAISAIQKINKHIPDVIFLDINMPKQSGFQVLEQLTVLPSVVFVTAHEKYALQALKSCALDFLLKPIDIRELVQTEKKLIQLQQIKAQIGGKYQESLYTLGSLMNAPGQIYKLTLPSLNGYEIYDVSSIIFVSGQDNYSTFHFASQKSLVVAKTLKEYDELLTPNGFLRIHKSTLINLSQVKTIKRSDSFEVVLKNEVHVLVSRRRMPELMDWAKQNGKKIE